MIKPTRLFARVSRPLAPFSGQMSNLRRYAHQSYGNEQSGHPQGYDEKNPKRHMEHPGPEAPATKDSSNKSDSSSTGASNNDTSTNNASPKIHEPKSAAEDSDPEVRKHNEEMRHRADRSANQLGEEDNKVDKKFWQGEINNKK